MNKTVADRIDDVINQLEQLPASSASKGLQSYLSVLHVAKGRIAFLEAERKVTPTARDQLAYSMLPVLAAQYGLENKETCIARCYQWADAMIDQGGAA